MVVHVEQFGLPRSGTNYVRWLWQINYDIKIRHRWGCKHKATKRPQSQDRCWDCVLLNTRHPMIWLVGYYYWLRMHGDARDFRNYLTEHHDYGMGLSGTPAAHWNGFHFVCFDTMKRFTNTRWSIVRHESIASEPERVSDLAVKAFYPEVVKNEGQFKQIRENMGSNGLPKAGTTFKNRSWETNSHMDLLKGDCLKIAKEQINWELAKQLGYEGDTWKQPG